jgi:hypothetical protein
MQTACSGGGSLLAQGCSRVRAAPPLGTRTRARGPATRVAGPPTSLRPQGFPSRSGDERDTPGYRQIGDRPVSTISPRQNSTIPAQRRGPHASDRLNSSWTTVDFTPVDCGTGALRIAGGATGRLNRGIAAPPYLAVRPSLPLDLRMSGVRQLDDLCVTQGRSGQNSWFSSRRGAAYRPVARSPGFAGVCAGIGPRDDAPVMPRANAFVSIS